MAKKVIFLLIPNLSLIAAFLLGSAEGRIEGAWTLKLASGYYLDYHISIQAVSLACPGVDYIRLWPLRVR